MPISDTHTVNPKHPDCNATTVIGHVVGVALMTRHKLAESEEPERGPVMSTKQAGVRRTLQEVRPDQTACTLKCGGWRQNKPQKGYLFLHVYFSMGFCGL